MRHRRRKLKFEAGGHRVQRVPVTESGGRIHTSAATVAVLPEIEDIDFVGGDYALCLIGEDVTVSSCTFTGQDSHNIIIYSVKGNSTISGNTFS